MIGQAHLETRKPELRFPRAEADWLRQIYGSAQVILEYGSGGSTVLAAELPGRAIFSVESDAAAADKLEAWFDAHPPHADVTIHRAPIGPTQAQGMPETDRGWRKYHRYPLSIWDRLDFRHPDTVLIDGRFRPACLLAVLYRASRPVTVLFDDYTGRDAYHEVEKFVVPAEIRGRMARFEISPQPFPAERMMDVMDFFTRPL